MTEPLAETSRTLAQTELSSNPNLSINNAKRVAGMGGLVLYNPQVGDHSITGEVRQGLLRREITDDATMVKVDFLLAGGDPNRLLLARVGGRRATRWEIWALTDREGILPLLQARNRTEERIEDEMAATRRKLPQ